MKRSLLTLILMALIPWSSAGSDTPSACITLGPLAINLEAGESIQAIAIAYDEIGNVIPDPVIQWLPTEDDQSEHCVSVSASGVITGKAIGSCGVGAVSVTFARRVITHNTPITVTVIAPAQPSSSPTPKPCSRLPNGKCKKGCICL